MLVLFILGALLLLILILYNSLKRRANQVDFAYSSIDALLKKRYDLIPNLVSTVQAYATHEREIFEHVSEYRVKAMNAARPDTPPSTGDRLELETTLSNLMNRVFAIAESYPDLKASENFLHLQRSLFEVEAQIAAARRYYNAAVKEYHNGLDTFPSTLIASLFGFTRRSYFTAPPEAREAPQVRPTNSISR